MGKFLYVFVAAISIALFYFIGFCSYIFLAVFNVLQSFGINIDIPFENELFLFQSVLSAFFFVIFPVLVLGFFIALVLYSGGFRPRNVKGVFFKPIRDPEIVVALTAYNDELSISAAVKDFIKQDNVTEVVVVDNNSTDETSKRASEAGARVVHETKQGYGYACIRGLKECLKNKEANIIVLAEGDRTFRGYDLRKLIPYLDNVDAVLGTRTGQDLMDKWTQLDWFMVWGNLFLGALVQLKFWNAMCWGKIRLSDVGCTKRAIRREALEKIIDQLHVGGDHFSPDMIMVMLKNELRMIEVPITFWPRVGKSKGASKNRGYASKIGLKMMWHILKF
ncbi:MAG: glycosyltransferase family 2 protein [Candidatus Bathyarchaeota archaeon]|nr:glycosyltransferase family 2 protein [Candidatus Bathyarchaeum sp.]